VEPNWSPRVSVEFVAVIVEVFVHEPSNSNVVPAGAVSGWSMT